MGNSRAEQSHRYLPGEYHSSEGLSIAVVDDEPGVLESVKSIIGRIPEQPVSEVRSFRSGQEALSSGFLDVCDLLITDIRMPVMNGIELMRRCATKPGAPLVAVLSGYDDFEYARSALDAGAIDYILKPVKVTKIAKTLGRAEKIVHRRGRETSAAEQPVHVALSKADEGLCTILRKRILECKSLPAEEQSVLTTVRYADALKTAGFAQIQTERLLSLINDASSALIPCCSDVTAYMSVIRAVAFETREKISAHIDAILRLPHYATSGRCPLDTATVGRFRDLGACLDFIYRSVTSS
jgi:YesN/AraC family two-component response regulator